MSINIDVPRAYLEMARAIYHVLNVEMKKWKDAPPDVGEEQMANVQFSLVSTIIIQCYMTIEAFINEELKDLWKESRKREDEIKKIKSSGIVEVRNAKSNYHEFYKKYGICDNFEDLKKEKNIRKLGQRINLICKTREILLIHESDKETWGLFKRMEKEYRHFLIHIYPEKNKFHDLVSDIFVKNELEIYFKTVQKVISHFYDTQNSSAQKWLNESTLFKFSGIDYL